MSAAAVSVSPRSDETHRTCAAPGCGRALEGRADAACCSARCRLRLHRHRQRVAAAGDDYDPELDYRRRMATPWDPAAELARVRALGLQPAAALVPPVDPADRLRGRTWRADPDPGDRLCPRPLRGRSRP